MLPLVPVPAALKTFQGRAPTVAEGDAVGVALGVCVAVWSVMRRTTLLHVSAMIHMPVPSGPIDGLFRKADVATPPSPAVPLVPAVPATVERMPAADTKRTTWFPCSVIKRPPLPSNATDVGLLRRADGAVAGCPSPRKPDAPHVPATLLMKPAALTKRTQWLVMSAIGGRVMARRSRQCEARPRTCDKQAAQAVWGNADAGV